MIGAKTGKTGTTAGTPQESALRNHLLHPGDVACGEQGERMETLLGSCVAVLLSDPRRTVGAMCHIVHPGGRPGGDTAYAEAALAQMQALLMARAIVPRLCQAWVIGGGNMFPALYGDPSDGGGAGAPGGRSGHVGASNAEGVLQALARDGIAVIGHDLGGTCYRRVRWIVGAESPRVIAVDVRS